MRRCVRVVLAMRLKVNRQALAVQLLYLMFSALQRGGKLHEHTQLSACVAKVEASAR